MPGLYAVFRGIPGVTPKGVLSAEVYVQVVNDVVDEETAKHFDFDTVSRGEFSVPAPGPITATPEQEYSLDVVAFDVNPSWMDTRIQSWGYIDSVLRQAMRARATVNLEMGHLQALPAPFPGARPTRPSSEIAQDVTIRNVRRTLTPGQAGVRYLTLTLKQQRTATTRRFAAGIRGGLPTSHKLTNSDTLHSLARLYYGSTKSWKAIATANHIRNWGSGTELVKMRRFKKGDKIVIPRKPA